MYLQFHRSKYWNAHASSSFDHAHWGYNSVFKQIRRCSVDGRKRYENDKCGRKSFWKRSKTAPFSFENRLVWTGPKTPSTLIRFQTKTELFCSGYGYRPHYNAENDHRRRSHSKTLSRVEQFENDAFWKRCFLVWTVKTMLSENGDVIKTTRPWVSKMADRRYHVASISRQFRGPIYWNVHASSHASSSFDHAHWGYNSVFKQIRCCSVDGRKRYESDKCGRKSFLKRSKTAPFSFENGLVWTGP